jgi:hypothetical protein
VFEISHRLQTSDPEFGPAAFPEWRIRVWQDGDALIIQEEVRLCGAIIATRSQRTLSVQHLLDQASLALAAQEGAAKPVGNLVPL